MSSQLLTNLTKIQREISFDSEWVEAIMNHQEYEKPKYIPIEFIQGTGAQMLITGVSPNSNTTLEIKFSWQGSNSGWGRLVGTNRDMNFELAAKSNSTFRWSINGNGTDVSFNGGNIQTVKITGTGKYYLNDTLKTDKNMNQNSMSSLFLLAIGDSGNSERGKAKIYYCKIWNR